MKTNSISLMPTVGLVLALSSLTSSVWANDEEAVLRALYAQAESLLSLYERCTVNVNVNDEEGHPIKGARVTTCVEKPTIRWNGSTKIDRYREKTDSNGKASCRIKNYDGGFSVYVDADGFHSENDTTNTFSVSYCMEKNRYVYKETEKTLTFTLRRVRNPVSMKYTCSVGKKRIPLKPGIYPFDLEIGDFVQSHCKGRIVDVEIVYEEAGRTPTNNVCKGFLRFPHGGAYVRTKIPSKSFPSEYEANTNETYLTELPFEHRFVQTANGGRWIDGPIDDSQYLVFRVREQRDENGKLISANYGKIYGGIETVGCMRYGEGYYNPVANSTSIEEAKRYGR